jgi:SseB protein N-terminal domain
VTSSADSAGVPWAGRTLSSSGFEADDGTADPRLARTLQAYSAGEVGLAAVAAAVSGVRVLVPVVAVAGEGEDSADMALVTLKSPDGRTALPVFSSVAALTRWDATARPVPVDARRAALSAVDEGCSLLVLDPSGPATAVLPRPALWAIAQGRGWTPSPEDGEVVRAVRAAATSVGGVRAARCEPGTRAELRVVLTVSSGLDRQALDALTERVSQRLASSEMVAERVDSLEVRVVALS